MADLITLAYLQTALAGGGLALSSAAVAAAPQLIAAASRSVRKHCNRNFTRQIFDGVYTVNAPNQFLLTREYPLNTIIRCAASPTVVLTIVNTDTNTNQRAFAELVQANFAADTPDLTAAVTGLRCTRIASGAAIINEGGANPFPFTTPQTVQQVANFVNSLGHGWSAAVTFGYAGWPTIDPLYSSAIANPLLVNPLCYFRPTQAALPALGSTSAGLVAHVQDLNVAVTDDTGEVDLSGAYQDDPFQSLRFGHYLATDIGDLGNFGGRNGIRLVYDAGLDVVYEDVQQAVVETVAYWMTLAGGVDQTITEETVGKASWKLSERVGQFGLPLSAVAKLSMYRNNRC